MPMLRQSDGMTYESVNFSTSIQTIEALEAVAKSLYVSKAALCEYALIRFLRERIDLAGIPYIPYSPGAVRLLATEE